MEINIQRAILASFLWANDMGTDTAYAFPLNQHLFTGDRYLIASKVNEITETEDKFYGILNLEIENTSHQEWLELSKTTPIPFTLAKKYHDNLSDPRGDKI